MTRKAKASDCWISEPGFRHYYTDADGADHDIAKSIEMLAMAKHLLVAAACPDPNCDHGAIPHQIAEDEWEAEQCQWCAEKLEVLTDG